MFKPEKAGKTAKPENARRVAKPEDTRRAAKTEDSRRIAKPENIRRAARTGTTRTDDTRRAAKTGTVRTEDTRRNAKPENAGRVIRSGKPVMLMTGENEKKYPSFEVRESTELLSFLMEKLQGISRNSAKSYCTLNYIRVDDRVEKRPNALLKPGQVVIIDKTSRRNAFKHPMLDIIYEDACVIVVNKKEGLLSVSATESDRELTAHRLLQEYMKKKDKRNRVFVVHRLDRETSGLMMFVKTAEIQQAFRENWKQVVYERSYVAVVEGRIKKEYDTIRSWIKENKDFLNYSSQTQGDGQEAVTHYKVIKRGATRTLIDVHLETGRKNQIRVHMYDIEHSIVGDQKYGISGNDPIGRLCLHAKVLSFYHPKTNELRHFETPVPKSFLSLIK